MRKNAGTKIIYVWIVIVLIVTEVLMRIFASSLSGNIRHIENLPEIASELSRSNSIGNRTILFLGNSLTANAVNLKQLEAEIRHGLLKDVTAFKVVPDGTSLWDWYCIVKNNYSEYPYEPNIIVTGYAWQQDSPDPSRLGGYFCNLSDLPDLVSLGMDDYTDILEFLVASSSRLFVLRETIRKRVLDLIIPGYRINTQKVNAVGRMGIRNTAASLPAHGDALIAAYIALLSRNGIRPVFIAMPVKDVYSLDAAFVREIVDSGGTLYDYRRLEGIDRGMFLDPIHLDKSGSEVFTRNLSDDLARYLSDGRFIE